MLKFYRLGVGGSICLRYKAAGFGEVTAWVSNVLTVELVLWVEAVLKIKARLIDTGCVKESVVVQFAVIEVCSAFTAVLLVLGDVTACFSSPLLLFLLLLSLLLLLLLLSLLLPLLLVPLLLLSSLCRLLFLPLSCLEVHAMAARKWIACLRSLIAVTLTIQISVSHETVLSGHC